MQPVVPLTISQPEKDTEGNVVMVAKDHYFHFNNYALIELGKIASAKLGASDEDPLGATTALNEAIQTNFLLGISAILYCGLVGYKYSKFQIKHGYSLEWCAEVVGAVSMNEWTPIWDAYKQATGMAEFLKNQPDQQGDKKKGHSKKNLSSGLAKSA